MTGYPVGIESGESASGQNGLEPLKIGVLLPAPGWCRHRRDKEKSSVPLQSNNNLLSQRKALHEHHQGQMGFAERRPSPTVQHERQGQLLRQRLSGELLPQSEGEVH